MINMLWPPAVRTALLILQPRLEEDSSGRPQITKWCLIS